MKNISEDIVQKYSKISLKQLKSEYSVLLSNENGIRNYNLTITVISIVIFFTVLTDKVSAFLGVWVLFFLLFSAPFIFLLGFAIISPIFKWVIVPIILGILRFITILIDVISIFLATIADLKSKK